MRRNVGWLAWVVAVLGLVTVSGPAQATPLPPGSVDVSVTNLASFSGTLVFDTGSLPYTFAGGSGTVREWVVSNATGALCAGCLSFVYQFQVATGTVGRLAAASYDAFTVDVSHNLGPSASLTGSVAGGFGANNADRDVTGVTIDFDFTSVVTAGQASFLEIANTNATAFQNGTITIVGGGGQQSATVVGRAPATGGAVPEPATILLLGSSLLAVGVWRKRI